MNSFHKLYSVLLTAVICITLAACGSKSNGSTYTFQYDFSPEKYEEIETLSLEANPLSQYEIEADKEGNSKIVLLQRVSTEENTGYQIELISTCDEGSLDISVQYMDSETLKVANSEAPSNDTITIPSNTTSEILIFATIEENTNGLLTGTIKPKS